MCCCGEISRSGNTEASQYAPAPNGGRGWCKGGDHYLKRGFLQSQKNHFNSLSGSFSSIKIASFPLKQKSMRGPHPGYAGTIEQPF
jgi:hypothetical protein